MRARDFFNRLFCRAYFRFINVAGIVLAVAAFLMQVATHEPDFVYVMWGGCFTAVLAMWSEDFWYGD